MPAGLPSAFRLRVDDEVELSLREERHADEVFALVDRNRADLRRFLPWLDHNLSAEDSRRFIRSTLEQLARNDGFQAGIVERGRLAGMIGYHRVDWSNRATSIGYWLGAEFRGRGLVTRACRALIDHALVALRLHRVEIRCAVENRASRAVAERLGFAEEGIARDAEWLYDRFVDHVVYAMLEPDWSSRRAEPGGLVK